MIVLGNMSLSGRIWPAWNASSGKRKKWGRYSSRDRIVTTKYSLFHQWLPAFINVLFAELPIKSWKKKTKVLSGLSCSSPIVRQHCLYGLYQNWKFLLPHAITFGLRLCKNFHRTIFSLSVFFIRKICGLSLWDDNVRKKYSINLFLCWLSTPDIF